MKTWWVNIFQSQDGSQYPGYPWPEEHWATRVIPQDGQILVYRIKVTLK